MSAKLININLITKKDIIIKIIVHDITLFLPPADNLYRIPRIRYSTLLRGQVKK